MTVARAKRSLGRQLRVLVAGLAALVVALAWPAAALEPPALVARVNDTAHLLPADSARELEQMLAAHEKKTGHQFAVLTIPSLEGDPLEDFSIRTVEKWRLGHAKVDDGLLVLVVEREHKVRIEVGYGLEGRITDVASSRVIRNLMVPQFRKHDYAAGLRLGIQELIRLDGSDTTAPEHTGSPGPSSGFGLLPLLMLLAPFVIIFLLINQGPRSGWGRRGWGGGWGGYGGWGGGGFGGGGWGGGSSGGGGGFSGGGGGFGGGGASGGW